MTYTSDIVLTTETGREDLAAFELEMPTKTLGDRIYACQSISENSDELSLAKLFVLYLSKERDVTNEMHRIFALAHPTEKALFLVNQIHAANRDIVFSALDLIKLLKQPLTIPYMQAIFKLEDIELSERIIAALGPMASPLAVKIIVSALDTTDEGLLHFTIQVLSRRTTDVKWHTFKKLLFHENLKIRREAAFAIAVRRDSKSATSIAHTIKNETDRETKHALITYCGMIPGKELLMPLLEITSHDPDNKSRLLASRALYRIQGITPSKYFFRLRNTDDPNIRAEVITRLGQFGLEEEKQKHFIRLELAKATTLNIVQACVQALGFTSDRADMGLLMEYLKRDPLTGYNAALALTRLWRSQDSNLVIKALEISTSSMQRQVFLKFLIHRRGLRIAPDLLLKTVRWLFENDANINVHYLSALLLEHAPSTDTIAHLLKMYRNIDDLFVKEAAASALRNIIKDNEELIIKLAHISDLDQFLSLIQFIPPGKDEAFYRELAAGIFDQEKHAFNEETLINVCNHAYVVLLLNHQALKQFLEIAHNTFWEKAFIKTFHDNATKDIVNFVSEELLKLLDSDDETIRVLILERLKDVDDPKILPKCMEIAEGRETGTAPTLAREIISSLAKRGIV